nr:O-antigen ligase family protein [uncultured Bacteroides sp.]
MVLFIIVALIISKSRTGIFCFIFMLIIYLYNYFPLKTKCKIVILSLFMITCLSFLYFLRKDSANGRLLIWKNTWDMIKDAPFLGNGFGAFRAHYMDFQANFFRNNIDSEYSMLADNVISPFNEYLSIALQYGFIGLLALLLFFLWLIYSSYKKTSIDKKVALLSFSGIGVFSFFSYPFTYPFIWIIVFLDIWVLCHERFKKTYIISHKKLLCFLVIICCLKAFHYLSLRIDAEYKWKNIAYQHPTKEILSCYAKLLPAMEENPFFLYNYAIALSEAGYIEESLKRAKQCRRYWADYDLELLLGENLKRQRRYSEAILHYKNASMMCPCRFIPLYQLFVIYKELGNKDKARGMALLILEKPVKVNSKVVMQIKYRIRIFLKEEYESFKLMG